MKSFFRSISNLFYLGTLISSIGNTTLSISIIAFMLKNNFSLFQVSLVIGCSRLIPIIISVFVGHIADNLPAKRVIIVTEILASCASILLLYGWAGPSKSFNIILIAMTLRTLFTSLQTGSRSQVAKMLSGDSYQANSRNAVWLNKVTQGATLFSGVLSWIAIEFSTLSTVIIFDALTFLANGIIIYLLPLVHAETQAVTKVSIFQKFKDLYKFNRRAATLDFLLSLAVMGTTVFTARLAGSKEEWISLFVISYGISVWLAGYIERSEKIQRLNATLWFILGGSLIWLGLFNQPSISMWCVCLLKDVSFWILFHRISSHIQMDTPKEIVGSVSFARNAQVMTVLTSGAFLVGAWSPYWSLLEECLFRGGICLVVAIAIAVTIGETENYEKASL